MAKQTLLNQMEPTMRYTILLLFIACTGNEKTVNVNNAEPTATITSHNDGDVVFLGDPIDFRATVSDSNDATADLEVQWSLNGRVVCPFVQPNTDGVSECTATLQQGEDTV